MREDEWLCPQSASFVLHLSANVFFCFQILDKTCTSFHSKQCSLITKREGHRRLETVVHDKTLIFQKVTTKVHLVPLCALTVNMNAGPKWRQECPTYQYVEQLITGSKKPPGTKLMLGYYYNILPMAFCNISGCKHSPDNR